MRTTEHDRIRVAAIAGASRPSSLQTSQSRLSPAGLAVLLTLACLTSARIAGAQGSDPSRLWVPIAKTKPAPVRAPAKPVSPPKPAAADSASLRLQERVAELERAAKEQSDVILALQVRIDSARRAESAPATDSASGGTTVAAPRFEELAKSVEAMTRHLDSLQKEIVAVEKRGQQRVSGLGNFRFSGDVRMRYEPTFQGGGTETRHRERTRARLHVTGAMGAEVTGGISIATGADNEPQSENQTHTGFFTRKTMAFERFFLNYKPKAIPGLSITAGKFPTPWARTPLTFSSDLYPEGVAGSYRTPIRNPVVDDLSVVGFWLPMLEVSGGPDSYLNGGQVQTKLRLGSATKAAASVAVINAVRADAIATAVAGGTFKPSWPTSNTVRTDSTGKVVGFAQGFRLMDVIVSAERAVTRAWPVAASVNVVKNASAGNGNNTGWLNEIKVGSTSSGSAQFTLTHYRIESDAVLSAFNVTDIRLGSNSVGHIAQASFRLRSDLVAGFTGYFGRVLDPLKTPGLVAPDYRSACRTAPYTGCRDPLWSRLQFDLLYSF